MSTADRALQLADAPPSVDAFTPYDAAHIAIYLSLLHASAEGATDAEMSRTILGINPDAEPACARRMLRSHLDRARWLSESGYHHLLDG